MKWKWWRSTISRRERITQSEYTRNQSRTPIYRSWHVDRFYVSSRNVVVFVRFACEDKADMWQQVAGCSEMARRSWSRFGFKLKWLSTPLSVAFQGTRLFPMCKTACFCLVNIFALELVKNGAGWLGNNRFRSDVASPHRKHDHQGWALKSGETTAWNGQALNKAELPFSGKIDCNGMRRSKLSDSDLRGSAISFNILPRLCLRTQHRGSLAHAGSISPQRFAQSWIPCVLSCFPSPRSEKFTCQRDFSGSVCGRLSKGPSMEG